MIVERRGADPHKAQIERMIADESDSKTRGVLVFLARLCDELSMMHATNEVLSNKLVSQEKEFKEHVEIYNLQFHQNDKLKSNAKLSLRILWGIVLVVNAVLISTARFIYDDYTKIKEKVDTIYQQSVTSTQGHQPD